MAPTELGHSFSRNVNAQRTHSTLLFERHGGDGRPTSPSSRCSPRGYYIMPCPPPPLLAAGRASTASLTAPAGRSLGGARGRSLPGRDPEDHDLTERGTSTNVVLWLALTTTEGVGPNQTITKGPKQVDRAIGAGAIHDQTPPRPPSPTDAMRLLSGRSARIFSDPPGCVWSQLGVTQPVLPKTPYRTCVEDHCVQMQIIRTVAAMTVLPRAPAVAATRAAKGFGPGPAPVSSRGTPSAPPGTDRPRGFLGVSRWVP